jgi:hypothetical protein
MTMTDRKDAITKLLAKVEAGAKYETMGHTILCQKAFPKPDDFDGSRKSYAESAAQLAILAWRNGSLGAAKALHEAVLPEYSYIIRNGTEEDLAINSQFGGGPDTYFANIYKKNPNTNPDTERFPSWSNSQARAWLIAILKALIADA